MILDPPLKRGAVDVTFIDYKDKTVNFVVYIVSNPEDIQSKEVQSWISRQITMAWKYLVFEGFVENSTIWNTYVAVLINNKW